MSIPKRTHDDYTIAWICPLEVEQVAALEMLDEEHPRLPQPSTDNNAYTLGSIEDHNVVIAGLSTKGNCSTATGVAHLKSTFPYVRFSLLVGVGGGVPTRTRSGPIRLGHVVVSEPTGQHSGVVQYDHGKAEADEFRLNGALARPPNDLLNAACRLAAAQARARKDPLQAYMQRIDTSIRGLRRYKHPGSDKDHLYRADYPHADRALSCRESGCDTRQRVDRSAWHHENDGEDDGDDQSWITVHRGTIASGEVVMRNGQQRDRLAKEYDVLCFEMEAAGALNDFPCLVIRGVSDYADSHKNDCWQGYAAATAAAYARGLFHHMPIPRRTHCKITESDPKEVPEDTQYGVHSDQGSRIKDWLCPPDQSRNFIEARELCHNGTGIWFLDSEHYLRWKTGLSRALWLHGIPGCGKTILSSTVIEDLKLASKSHRAVLYFYFDFKDVTKQTLDKMLRSLIFQLYQWSQESHLHIEQLRSSCSGGGEQPHTHALATTFQSATEAVGDVWLVLDALDECATRKELLAWLESPAAQQIQILVTSREEHDIRLSLMKWMAERCIIPIQTAPVDEDIRVVVRNTIEKDEDFTRWREWPEARTMIETELLEKARGMFRLAICQLDCLRDCLDWLSLEQTLESLPETLEKIYNQMLRNIPQQHRSSAIRILQFLAYAERPLRLEEAVDVIAVRLDSTPPFSAQYRMPDPSEIARYCASLTRIVTRNESREGSKPKIVTELQLAHQSVQELLTSGRVESTMRDWFQESRAKGCIVQVSLAYLCEASRDQREGVTDAQLPLKEFAARYWMNHAPSAEKEGNAVVHWIHELLTSEESRKYWLEIYDPEWPYCHLHGIASALYYASLGGLTTSVGHLLDRGAQVNREEGRCGYAIQAASFGGHAETVTLLLNRGAQVDAKGGKHGYALQAASDGGHLEVVKLLLERGAHVNARGSIYGYALQAASDGGHLEVVRLLLSWGAHVNANGGEYGHALQAASNGGHLEVVRLLLDNGADIHAKEDGYGHALQIASNRGHIETVRLLLDRGADVNARGGIYGHALQAASDEGYIETVQLLLDSGADVNAEGGMYGCALQAASDSGHVEIVRLLLNRGAEVNALGGEYGSALQAASDSGHIKTVELLLERGADVNFKGGKYGSALQAASDSGHIKTIELLLEWGADVNVKGGKYGSVLRAASDEDRVEVVELLKGAKRI